jgi:hypothetical protein
VLVVGSIAGNGACNSYDVVVSGLSCPFELISAASRKTHAAAGEFDVVLPLSGTPGIEPRNSGGNHTFVVTFSEQVVSGSAAVTSGTGTAGAPTFIGSTMRIPLSGVTDQQKITVTLTNVTSSLGQVLPTTAITAKMLVGDSNGDVTATVNSGDAQQVRSRSGQTTNSTNFRSDVNTDGTINAGDATIVRARSGNFVP